MLRIYMSRSCHGCHVALMLADRVCAVQPAVPLAVIDVDAPDAAVPPHVIGTPTYTWHDRIVALGNPSEVHLLELIQALYAAEY